MTQVTIHLGVGDDEFLLRFPIAHIERIRNHPRAWLEVLQQFGTKLEIDMRQQEQGHYRSLANVRLEQIILLESNQFLHAGLSGVLLCLADPYRVDIDSDSASAKVLGSGNHNAAIAAAKVVY